MNVFTAAPYNLAYEQMIVARIRAVNSYGYGDWSDLNTEGETIKSVPLQMPIMETVYTTTENVEITFTEGFLPNTLNGGYDITFVHLYSDSGLGGSLAQIL